MNWFQRHLNWTWILAFLLWCAVVRWPLMFIVVGIEEAWVAVLVLVISSNILLMAASGWVIHRKGQSLWFVLLSGFLSPLWLENCKDREYQAKVIKTRKRNQQRKR